MTRKTFVATARIIAGVDCPATRRNLATEFAAIFRAANRAFDSARFYAACGIE